jgi:hypothetical protein
MQLLMPPFAGPVQLPLFLPLADGFPFVEFLFALGQAQFYFSVFVLEIQFERDQGVAPLRELPQETL